ncbi:MAG: AAA family ATPase, partial [Candidatus Eremiobacteraeota bacterium]|nr:AAA family ATPase [Candidatus Eremiobacteraeota bacterium]
MLLELHIQNLAIFDEVRQTLGSGLNVLTGETGAGKSLLAGALTLLLGERGDPGQIRTGEDVATIEALFDIEHRPETRALLTELGLEDDEEIVLRRVLRRGSRGSASVNGSLVPVAQLARIAESLISIVGQHSHQRLLRPSHHLALL